MITYENALKLRESGFPQPEAEFGQKWYYKNPDLPVRLVLVGTAEWNLVSYKSEMLVYAPTALEILAQLRGFAVTCGKYLYVVECLEIQKPIHSEMDIDSASATFYLDKIAAGAVSPWWVDRPKVKYLIGKGYCPENVTIDGVELECGDMHLWKSAHSDVENGIYTIGVDPVLADSSETTAFIQHPDGLIEKISPKGFAGTYTPLPEVEKTCINCKHWVSFLDFWHDLPDQDPDNGICSVGHNADFTPSKHTCSKWRGKILPVKEK
jgi:hypothetical protein